MAMQVALSAISSLLRLLIPVIAVLLSYQCFLKDAVRRLRAGRRGCQEPPKTPLKDPVLGLDGLLASVKASKSRTYLARQKGLYKLLGQTFSGNFLGSYVLNTAEPENIRTILSDSFHIFEAGRRRRDAFFPLFRHGIFQLDGQQWKHSRKLLEFNFSYGRGLEIPIIERAAGRMMAQIDSQSKQSGKIDLQPFFDEYAADIGFELILGQGFPAADSLFLETLHEAQKGCELRWLLDRLTPLWPQAKFKKDIAFIQERLDMCIKQAWREESQKGSASASETDSLLRKLLRTCPDEKVVQDEILTAIIAAIDTVAAVLISLFFLLAKHPQAWQKVRSECAALGTSTLTIQELKQLTYTRGCVNETLRLYPVLPNNSRVANADTVLPVGGGPEGKDPIFVPKGTMVSFSMHQLHRRPDLWGEDADAFRPERWEGESDNNNWKFVPFNAGPRICMGRELAYNEAVYAVCRIAQTFKDIQSDDPGPWVEDISLACTSKNGAKVVLIRE